MKLYIANPTHQPQTVFWRSEINESGTYDERRARNGLRSVDIGPRKQVALPDFVDIKQVQAVMDRLAKVGGVGTEELNRLPRARLAYIMSVDRRVTDAEIQKVSAHNRGVAMTGGTVRRKAAALAANAAVERMLEQTADANVRNMTVEFEQQPDQLASEDNLPSKERIAEGFDIVKPGENPNKRKQLRSERLRADS
jgi:hypothetical protein